MTWLRVDDVFVDHPKVEALSDAAFRLHMRAMSYCARFTTDGKVPRAKVAQWGKHRLIVECLRVPDGYEVGCWEESGDSYIVHDYLVYNPSRAEIEEANRKKSEAGAKGAAIRYGKAGAIAGATANGWHKPVPSPSRPTPDPVPSDLPLTPAVAGERAERAKRGSKRKRDVDALEAQEGTDARYFAGKYGEQLKRRLQR